VGGTGAGRRRKVVVPRGGGRGGAGGEDQAGKEEAKFLGRGLEKVFSVDEGEFLTFFLLSSSSSNQKPKRSLTRPQIWSSSSLLSFAFSSSQSLSLSHR